MNQIESIPRDTENSLRKGFPRLRVFVEPLTFRRFALGSAGSGPASVTALALDPDRDGASASAVAALPGVRGGEGGGRPLLIVQGSGGVISEKLAVWIVVRLNGEASFPTHSHAPRRRRHAFVRRHNERVSPLVREIVMLLEHGKLDGAKVLTDLGEREPADLDGVEEASGQL